jgi:hypothetical protein
MMICCAMKLTDDDQPESSINRTSMTWFVRSGFFRTITKVFLLVLMFPLNVSASWDWDVQGSSAVSYDTNITSASRDEISDVITRFSVGLGGTYTSRKQLFDARVNLIRNLFFDHSALDHNEGNLETRYSRDISERQRFRLTNRFVSAEELTGFEDLLGALSGRYRFYRNRFRLEYDHDMTKQWRLVTYYSNELYRVSREDSSDSIDHGAGVALQWIWSSATIWSLAYQGSIRDYDPGDQITVNAALLGVRQYFSPRFFVDVKAGASRRISGGENASTQPRITVGVNYEISQPDSLRVEFSNTAISNLSSVNILESWRVAVSWSRQLLRRLRAEVGSFYGEGEFEDSDVTETVLGFTGRLRYDVTDHVRLFTSLGVTEKQSNVGSREYEKSVWMLGLEFVF